MMIQGSLFAFSVAHISKILSFRPELPPPKEGEAEWRNLLFLSSHLLLGGAALPALRSVPHDDPGLPLCFLSSTYFKNLVIPTGASPSKGRGIGVEEPAFSLLSSALGWRSASSAAISAP